MRVELGNPAPVNVADAAALPGPAVTYLEVPDSYTCEPADVNDLARHLAANPGLVSHLPGQEAFVAVVRTWGAHSGGSPSWVWSDNPDFAQLLGEFYDCPVGRPDDLEDTHHTNAGPPGVAPYEEDLT
jgi:hypothetical protein